MMAIPKSLPPRIGVDLGGTKIEAIALDSQGLELCRHRIASPHDDYNATIVAVRDLALGLERQVGHGEARVGVGIPGAMSRVTGLVKNANSTWLIGHPLDTDLAEALDRPVRVQNDANCFAVSEASDGAAAGSEVVFGVILGTGVGAGIALNGKAFDGANGIAGEWGHNALPLPTAPEQPGRTCYCGRPGCLETWLSGPSMSYWYHMETGRSAGPAEIVETAGREPAAAAFLNAYIDRLARGLASVINILDPDVIVLGGGLSNIQLLYERVPHVWGRYVFSDRVTTKLLPPKHGDSSGVRGAAWLWPADTAETPV
jgi:fructokinase